MSTISVLEKLLKFVIAERDCFFENCSIPGGDVPDEADREELDRIDVLIDEGQAELNKLRNQRDPLGEALNSGDGSYRP